MALKMQFSLIPHKMCNSMNILFIMHFKFREKVLYTHCIPIINSEDFLILFNVGQIRLKNHRWMRILKAVGGLVN